MFHKEEKRIRKTTKTNGETNKKPSSPQAGKFSLTSTVQAMFVWILFTNIIKCLSLKN